MLERFPIKKEGDRLGAGHVNELSQVAETFAKTRPGTFLSGRHTGTQYSLSGPPLGYQFVGIISDNEAWEGDEAGSGYYLVKVRWFSHDDNQWYTDDQKEWILDATSIGDTGSLTVGTILIVSWDQQRGMYVPITGSTFSLTELMLAEDHPGRGIIFKCYLGSWCPNTNDWRYDCTDECDDWVYAIDFRYGMPSNPGAGARGLFTPRASTTYGTIWDCVSLDCESPGVCSQQGIDLPCPETPTDTYDGICTSSDNSSASVSEESSLSDVSSQSSGGA